MVFVPINVAHGSFSTLHVKDLMAVMVSLSNKDFRAEKWISVKVVFTINSMSTITKTNKCYLISRRFLSTEDSILIVSEFCC